MRWTIQIARPAQKTFAKAPAKSQRLLRAALEEMQQNPFSGDIVRLTSERSTWRRSAARHDSEIGFSEIPPLKAFRAKRRPESFRSSGEAALTIRLDADVVAWLRRRGKGCQTRLSQMLRQAMLQDIKKGA